MVAQGIDADADFHIVSRAQACVPRSCQVRAGRKVVEAGVSRGISPTAPVNVVSSHKRPKLPNLKRQNFHRS